MLAVVTRAEARAAGEARYFSGKPCKRGHVSERHVVNGDCIRCARDRFLRIQKERREEFNERQRAWRQENAAHVNEYHRKRWRENAEAFNERARARNAANPEPRRKSRSRWKAENRDWAAANRAQRRAAERSATPAWVDKAALLSVYSEAKVLREAGQDVHVDHIVPLVSPVVCGLHVPWNLRVIPAQENYSKNNRLLDDVAEMREHIYAPLSASLALLTEGWLVTPLAMPHGTYSVLATKSVEPEGEAK